SRAASSVAVSGAATATTFGRKARICCSSSSTFRPAASATTSKRSGKRETTSSALRPMEPVDPRMESLRGAAIAIPSTDEKGLVSQGPGRHEKQRIQAVEDPAVSGDELARVLHVEGALDHRLGEISERPEHAGNTAQHEHVRPVER